MQAKVSAVIPTWNRVEKLFVSMRLILDCDPPPAELIVHVDAGDTQTAAAVRKHFPDVKLLESSSQIGPGGGRNRLLATAGYELVASFDDDSYPLDRDYFRVLDDLFARFPEAAVVGARVIHEGEAVIPRGASSYRVADFVGCACAYRREAFLATKGYVPLPVAYGMEEVDLSLRLHDRGWAILKTDALRVFHATSRHHHANAVVTRASIANMALLTFLRYPVRYWWIGVGQVFNRVVWLLRHRRWTGLIGGLVCIPTHLYHHRSHRGLVAAKALRNYLALRRQAGTPTVNG